MTVEADCRRLVETATTGFGGLDIVVNCAGIVRRTSVVDTTEADWDRVMAVNVKAVFLLGKHAIPEMARGGGGAVVNIGSGWGLKGGPRAASYCASKGAVVNLTRAMAIDHGPQGIRVNCVCPGDTDTPLLRSEAQQLGEDEAAFLASSAERPIRRLGNAGGHGAGGALPGLRRGVVGHRRRPRRGWWRHRLTGSSPLSGRSGTPAEPMREVGSAVLPRRRSSSYRGAEAQRPSRASRGPQ